MSTAAMYPPESAPDHPDYTDTMLLGSAVRVALQALSRTLRRDEQDRTLVSVARIEQYLRLVLDQFPTAAEHRARGRHAAAVRATSLGCDNLADGHLTAAYLALINAHDALGGTAT